MMQSAHLSTAGTIDRRRHDRLWTVRGCRVRAVSRVRAETAETANVSESGALIRIGSTGTFGLGDEVEVVVAWDGEGLVRAEQAVRGVIRRIVPMDFHHQAIAVEFQAAVGGGTLADTERTRAAA